MPDAITLTRRSPATIAVLANDLNPDVSPVALVAVGQPGTGTAEISGHAIIYTPDVDEAGTDTFTYTVRDGAFSAVGVVTVAPPMTVLYLPVMRR